MQKNHNEPRRTLGEKILLFIQNHPKISKIFLHPVFLLSMVIQGSISLSEANTLLFKKTPPIEPAKFKYRRVLCKTLMKGIPNLIRDDEIYFNDKKVYFESEVNKFSFFFALVLGDQYRAQQTLSEDSVVIDAGANTGLYSMRAATVAQKGNVYAFEPDAKNYELLKKNTSGYENIHTYNLGLGDTETTKKFFAADYSGEYSHFVDNEMPVDEVAKEGMYVDISVTTIDGFVKKNNIQKVDFIKMDVEGYEAKVLEGARDTIKKFTPQIGMSAYHHKEDKHDLPAILKSIDKRYVCVLHRHPEEDFYCYIEE